MHYRPAKHIDSSAANILTGLAILAVVACALAAAGCVSSSQDGGAQCDEVLACGGNLVGAWELEAFCGDLEQSAPSNLPPACSDLLSDIRVQPGATYTFDATTYVVTGLTLEADFVYTQPCIEALSGSGARLDAAFCQSAEDSINDDPDFDGGSCTFTASACRCTAYTTPRDAPAPMDYQTEDNALVDPSDGTHSPYCVEGDTLVIRSPDMVDGIAGQLVLRRQ